MKTEKLADFSVPVISKKFDDFNKKYFNGQLTKPEFKLTLSRKSLGKCSAKAKGFTMEHDYTISISTFYEVSENDMENTLIHEMIHLYQHQILKEKMNHKTSFKDYAKKVYEASNGKYDISRCSSRANCKLSTEGQIKADRQELNAKKPIIMICKESVNNQEYAWFLRITDNYYQRMNLLSNNMLTPTFQVFGFIFDKPKTWMYHTSTCRKKLRGKKLEWNEFVKKHSKDIIPLIVNPL